MKEFAFYAQLLICSALTVNGLKEMDLTIMVLIQATGNEPADGRVCRAATEFVFSEANKIPDILPGYRLKAEYRNEGPSSIFAPRQLVQYVRSLEGNQLDFVPSPVTLGPQSTIGCMSYATALAPLNMIGLTTGCGSPIFSNNRKKYKNIFRLQLPGDVAVYARLAFLLKATNWRRLGLLTSSRPLDFEMSRIFYRQSVQKGFDIGWYDVLDSDISAVVSDDMITSLKLSNIRILFIDLARPQMLSDFLCTAYHGFVRGPIYTFLASGNGFQDPTTLPQVIDAKRNCTLNIVLEQLRFTLFVGLGQSYQENHGKTLIGYDVSQFDYMFANWTNNSLTSNFEYPRRYHCHDAALMAVNILDKAEKRMAERNMSLKDFGDLNKKEIVYNLVYQTTSEIEFTSLRHGKEAFSPRLEMDDYPVSVFKWNNATNSVKYYYKLVLAGNITDLNHYQIRNIQPIDWPTIDGKAPLDSPHNVLTLRDVPDSLAITVTVLAAIASLAQILSGLSTLRKDNAGDESIRCKSCILIGCILANAASVCFAQNIVENQDLTSVTNKFICYLRNLLTAISVSLIHGVLISKLALFRKELTHCVTATNMVALGEVAKPVFLFTVQRAQSTPNSPVLEKIYPKRLARSHEKLSSYSAVGLAAFSLSYVIVWYVSEPLQISKRVVATTYVEINDTFFTTMECNCGGPHHVFWRASLVAIHGCVLLFGALLSYSLRSVSSAFSAANVDLPGFNTYRLAQTNSITLYVGSVMVIVGLNVQISLQYGATAVSLLLFSLATFAIIFKPSLNKLTAERNSSIQI